MDTRTELVGDTPTLGLASIPEAWIPLGAMQCSVSDGSRCSTARVARTPHTLEVLFADWPRLHVSLTDGEGPGTVHLSLRPLLCLPALAPQIWTVRAEGGAVRLERRGGGAGLTLRRTGGNRLHAELWLPGEACRSFEVSS